MRQAFLRRKAQEQRNTKIAAVFIYLGVVAFGIWIFIVPNGQSLLAMYEPSAPGIVTDVTAQAPSCHDPDCAHILTIQFTPPHGTQVTFQYTEGFFSYKDGEHVTVNYDPKHPHDATLARPAIIAGGMVVVTLVVLIGFGILIFAVLFNRFPWEPRGTQRVKIS